jgi:hypothetical protein
VSFDHRKKSFLVDLRAPGGRGKADQGGKIRLSLLAAKRSNPSFGLLESCSGLFRRFAHRNDSCAAKSGIKSLAAANDHLFSFAFPA